MKKIMCVVLCVAFLSAAAIAAAENVYVTANGKKYHKENCRWIKNRETTEIDKKEAIEQGLTPCKRCFKDEVSTLENKGKKSEKKQLTKKK